MFFTTTFGSTHPNLQPPTYPTFTHLSPISIDTNQPTNQPQPQPLNLHLPIIPSPFSTLSPVFPHLWTWVAGVPMHVTDGGTCGRPRPWNHLALRTRTERTGTSEVVEIPCELFWKKTQLTSNEATNHGEVGGVGLLGGWSEDPYGGVFPLFCFLPQIFQQRRHGFPFLFWKAFFTTGPWANLHQNKKNSHWFQLFKTRKQRTKAL